MCYLHQSLWTSRYIQRPTSLSECRQRLVPVPAILLSGSADTVGSSMALDLCSVLMLPSMTRRWSFVSQALGLMVDLDIGTENLRWMGDTRFVLGFLKGVVSSNNFKARIRINVVEDDKVHMARIARERSHVAPATMGAGLDPLNPGKGAHKHAKSRSNQLKDENADGKGKGANGIGNGTRENGNGTGNGASQDDPSSNKGKSPEPEDDGPLPEAKPLEPTDSWLTIDSGGNKKDGKTQTTPDSILYFYAGMMPWVSRDLNQWPVATVGQGVVDIAIQRVVSPLSYLTRMS
jgi:sphingosine kinase